jgi:2-polyprenyl-6-methoxyphenol hydroxylase-like FAD-dependent oxidoreductase
MGPADLYRAEGYQLPGLVLIGDAFQSVCPTTGTGVSKVLTDVDVLCECIPEWFKTHEMGIDKLACFYEHPRKIACDRWSLEGALYTRAFSIAPSFRWTVQRHLAYLWLPLAYRLGNLKCKAQLPSEKHGSC